MMPPTEDELTVLHVYMEDILIEFRDGRLSELCANGLVVRERDGTPSPMIRIGTRAACRMIIRKFLDMRGDSGEAVGA